MNDILLMIPAYNEEKNIQRVVENLKDNYPEYDYVVINDGSKDDTSLVCHREGYNIIDLPVNLGLAGAFQAGIKYADEKGYAYAVQFDADGQHLPEYIEPLRLKMQEGYDIVIGSRFATEKKPTSLRMLGSRMIELAIKLTTRSKIKDPTSGMRMYDKRMIHEFSRNINYGPEPDTISYLIKNGVRIAEVQVKMEERFEGESYLNFGRSISYMLRMMISIIIVQNVRKRNS